MIHNMPSPDALTAAGARREYCEPAFEWGGLMITLRYGPTDLDVLGRIIDAAGRAGVNVLEVDIGNAIRLESCRTGIADWGLSKGTLREVLRPARQMGMIVIPIVPIPGRADGSFEAYFRRLDEVMEVFDPPYVHVGCEGGPEGGGVSVERVHRYVEGVKRKGCGTIMWADRLLRQDHEQEDPNAFPEDVIVQVGNYQPLVDYSGLDRLLQDGRQVVCSPWRGANVYLMARYAAERSTGHLRGMIQTEWRRITADHADDLVANIRYGALCAWNPRLLRETDDPLVAACEQRRERQKKAGPDHRDPP